jgi:hypothetical protein
MFASISAIGTARSRQIISLWWYDIPDAQGALDNAALSALLDAWVATVQPPLAAFHNALWSLNQLVAQGYSNEWQRQPYIPLIRDVSGVVGSVVSGMEPPITCGILSCRVEPVVPGRRKKPDGTIVTTPIRRGYFAIGPLSTNDVQDDGTFVPSSLTSSRFTGMVTAATASLAPSGWAAPATPIRVSRPLKDEVARGHGKILGAVWRKEISARRSRRTGVGS